MKKRFILMVCCQLICVLMFISGCATTPEIIETVVIEPTSSYEPYLFMENHPILGGHYRELYPYEEEDEWLLSAHFTEPRGYTIEFYENQPEIVGKSISPTTNKLLTFQFSQGVYPFSLYMAESLSDERFSGAIAVFNLDETLELATFGDSKETKLFNPEMIQKARDGILTNYTMSFDEKNVIVYWLGNRKNLYPGGAPTVELDFSVNPNVKAVTIDDEIVKNRVAVLGFIDEYPEYICKHCKETGESPIYDFSDECYDSENERHDIITDLDKITFPFEMTMHDGKGYKGYIRKLKSSVYSSFISIPCFIPNDLFKTADKGTIAKLTINSAGDKQEEIVELVFGTSK